MRLDPIIMRRFAELEAKAEPVLKAKTPGVGTTYFKVPSGAYKEWATNVLNLLQRTFGESSIHYKNFSGHYANFLGMGIRGTF